MRQTVVADSSDNTLGYFNSSSNDCESGTSCFRLVDIAVLRFDPNPHTTELCNEGVRVRAISKAEPRVLYDFEHTASSISRLTVPSRVTEFVHFANAIGRWDLDRDLVGKIAINLPLRNLTFASDHRCQKVKSEAAWTTDGASGNNARDLLYQRDTAGPEAALTFRCQSSECGPPSTWTAQKGLDGGKSLVSAATPVLAEAISTTIHS